MNTVPHKVVQFWQVHQPQLDIGFTNCRAVYNHIKRHYANNYKALGWSVQKSGDYCVHPSIKAEILRMQVKGTVVENDLGSRTVIILDPSEPHHLTFMTSA